jgi:hypothetical protein
MDIELNVVSIPVEETVLGIPEDIPEFADEDDDDDEDEEEDDMEPDEVNGGQYMLGIADDGSEEYYFK